MKRLHLLLFFAILLFCSCGKSYDLKPGQTVTIKFERPCADTKANMEQLHHYISFGKKTEAMEMYYRGEAFLVENYSSVTIIKIDGDYAKVKIPSIPAYDSYWMYCDDIVSKKQ